MPGILTPPQRVSRLYSHTLAGREEWPPDDAAAYIIVLGDAGGDAALALCRR